MQTFLPYSDFLKSIQCLDTARLGKQRVEAFQILNVLLDRSSLKRRKNHPAMKMWVGYEDALKEYYNTCLMGWVGRGYKNSMLYETMDKEYPIKYPSWIGNEKFHSAHRSRLLFKGEVDRVCDALYGILKVDSINKWLKENGYGSKNSLKYEDLLKLKKLTEGVKLEDNWYSQFGWQEPMDLPYIWPVN